jgi:hypothetical protein
VRVLDRLGGSRLVNPRLACPVQINGTGTTFGSTELLIQSWTATGLGFALNHIEALAARTLLLHHLAFQVVVDGVAARQVHAVWS